MTNWQSLVGALFIVAAMVLGAFGGLAAVQPDVSPASSDGTRSESPMLGTSPDEMYTPEDARSLFDRDTAAAFGAFSDPGSAAKFEQPSDGLELDSWEVVSRLNGVSRADGLTKAQLRATIEGSETDFGTISARRSGDDVGTRAAGDPVDVGGPYVGFEGDTVHFSLTVNDPAFILFQYDFDGDGTIDLPDQAGAPPEGAWTTITEVDYVFYDNFRGNVVVRSWDGVSRIVVSETNLGETASVGLFNYSPSSGWLFTAKADVTVTELGLYNYEFYPPYLEPFSVRIWDTVTEATIAQCSPTQIAGQWNWCPVTPAIDLLQGHQYVMAGHKGDDFWPFWPDEGTPTALEFVDICCRVTTLDHDAYPYIQQPEPFIPKVDFRIRTAVPDAIGSVAAVDIDNIAPSPADIRTNPSPAVEGPNELSAHFGDPGLWDTWQFRYRFHDGEVSDWENFHKFQGAGLPPVRVLILHTWTFDIGGIESSISRACGSLCESPMDTWDFGPFGEHAGELPDLDTMLQYDVVVTGTNYFFDFSLQDPFGDLLADYMDRGGNVVGMGAIFDASFSGFIGIAAMGRWQAEPYSPLALVPLSFSTQSLGKQYVREGHEVLDGVAGMTAFYRDGATSVKAGARRIADFSNSEVLAATRELGNGARTAALPWLPLSVGGDGWTTIANAILWADRALVRKPTPYALDPFTKVFADDDPTTTTPSDEFPVSVDVRDDDDGVSKTIDTVVSENFNSPSTCSWATPDIYAWPAGWLADPTDAWRCVNFYGYGPGPSISYYFWFGFGDSTLFTATYDFSAYVRVTVDWSTLWCNFFSSETHGYVEASVDGGATFPILLREYMPFSCFGFPPAGQSVDAPELAGYSDVVIRFRYSSDFDYFWFVDDFKVTGYSADVYAGLGSVDGTIRIENVQPQLTGSFDSTLSVEADGVRFGPYNIVDPAMGQPTEWFAAGTDFGDGTPMEWEYLGVFQGAKNVLLVHSLCLDSDECAESDPLTSQLRGAETVRSVDAFGIINSDINNVANIPSSSLLMKYDVIVFATLWAWGPDYFPWDDSLRVIGDMLADYVDTGRGGVVTLMRAYDCFFAACSFFADWHLRGRYVTEDYGPFETTTLRSSLATLGTIYDSGHAVMEGVRTGAVQSSSGPFGINEHGGDYRPTAGASVLADWTDGASAIGAKELPNGIRTVHIAAIGSPVGEDAILLLSNAIGWAGGGFDRPILSAFDHVYGDNGQYTVDLMIVDDDMGFVWDATIGEPVQVEFGPGTGIVHRLVSVSVDNSDPVIQTDTIQAFIAAQACVRVSGTGGNTVAARFFADGVLSSSVSVTRESGSPNPTTDKCGLLKVDVRAAHSYSATLTYTAPMGGSNPTWLEILPWRDPVSPGHGTVSYKYDFADNADVVTQPLPTLKRDLLDSGQGAKIDFSAIAVDRGTDDLAFFWIWGAENGVPYQVPNPADAVYTIHVHHNDGTATTDGSFTGLQSLGFTDPYFDRAANAGTSPWGTTNFAVRDTAVHSFVMGQTMYMVVLIVLDDDNTRGYPSHFAPNDGVDMAFIFLNLG